MITEYASSKENGSKYIYIVSCKAKPYIAWHPTPDIWLCNALHALWLLVASVHTSCCKMGKELKGQNLLIAQESLPVRCCFL